MSKGMPTINLEIEMASSALSVLRELLAEQIHDDDRKQIDELIEKAGSALEKASCVLSALRRQLEDVADQL